MLARELNNIMDLLMNKYSCPGCGYDYDESIGDEHEGYPPGMPFSELPDDFVCPACSVRYKEDFIKSENSSL